MLTAKHLSVHEDSFRKLDDAILTEKDRKKAEVELNETPQNQKKCIAELRRLLKGEKDLVANTSDEFLLKFLRAKKYRIEQAFLRIKNYYKHRLLYPNIYQNFTPSQTAEVRKVNFLNYLPLRTSDGCSIWVVRIAEWNPLDFDSETFLRFGIMCHMKDLENPVSQINGLVTIMDLKGFSRVHLYHLSMSIIKALLNVLQEALPIRQKAVHIVNIPSFFGRIFAIVKPFIKHKFRDRIHMHGYDLTSLHQYLPPCILPEELGGTQGPFQNKKFYESVQNSEEKFLEEENYGYKCS